MNNQQKKRIYPWGNSRRFNAYSDYFKRRFGERIQKVTIDAGFTCPNRDGTKGYGGCSYCDNDAFNPAYCKPSKDIATQIREGMDFHKKRYRRARRYLAYFQAYSNTYAPLDELKKIYDQALNYPGVEGLVIGTRPDCMDDEKLEYFEHLARDYYIILEYGIESFYNRTLEHINRGHTVEESIVAVEKTAQRGIHAGAHLIFGLPGETRDDMLRQADMISQLPLDTVKFHQLQIIKNTAMDVEYRQHPEWFDLFSLEEYIDFIIRFMEKLNPAFVIERFSGEVPPWMLTKDAWGEIRTHQVRSKLEQRMHELNTWQGKFAQYNSFNSSDT